MSLAGFLSFPFTFDEKTRTVYTRGRGPGIVVMHEVPGITPEVAGFARRVADAGFRVYAPSLFGTLGKVETVSYDISSMLYCCISREFKVLAANESSPITDWLRALCRHAHAECGGPGVGAIGMCMTGNFALALMVDESVLAPVLSLPSPYTRAQREGLHLSPGDLEIVKRRAAAGCGVLAMRFTGDPLCGSARFERLRRELGDGVETIEIDSRPGNPWNLPKSAHSVVTRELVDEAGHPTRAALERVLGFFKERLTRPEPVMT